MHPESKSKVKRRQPKPHRKDTLDKRCSKSPTSRTKASTTKRWNRLVARHPREQKRECLPNRLRTLGRWTETSQRRLSSLSDFLRLNSLSRWILLKRQKWGKCFRKQSNRELPIHNWKLNRNYTGPDARWNPTRTWTQKTAKLENTEENSSDP